MNSGILGDYNSSCPRLQEEDILQEEEISAAILLNSLKIKIMLISTSIKPQGIGLPREHE